MKRVLLICCILAGSFSQAMAQDPQRAAFVKDIDSLNTYITAKNIAQERTAYQSLVNLMIQQTLYLGKQIPPLKPPYTKDSTQYIITFNRYKADSVFAQSQLKAAEGLTNKPAKAAAARAAAISEAKLLVSNATAEGREANVMNQKVTKEKNQINTYGNTLYQQNQLRITIIQLSANMATNQTTLMSDLNQFRSLMIAQ